MNISLQSTHPLQNKFILGVIYLLIAISFVFIANDNDFFELIKIPSFYTDIVFSVTVTFGIRFYLKQLNFKLDTKYPWYKVFGTRITKQAIFGVLIPLCIAMLLEIIYLYSIGISFKKSSILNLELPLALIFLVLINSISLSNYLFKYKQKEIVIVKEEIIINTPNALEYINVQRGYVEERIELINCALIYSASKLLWLQTYDGEIFRLQGTLEEWEGKLKSSNFYRINRQYICSFKAIKSVEQTETRKLKVNFVVPTDEVYISKPNVVHFKLWWKQ